MKFIYSVLLIATIGVAVQAMPSAVQSQMQSTLQKYMEQASMDSTNPNLSAQCFALYLPMLNEVASSFSSEYQACINIANSKTSNLTAEAAKGRAAYQEEIRDICSSYTYCDNENDTVAFFNCYSGVSADEVSVLYNLSSNSANSATVLMDGIKQIQEDQNQCTQATESSYVRNTASTYDLLDNCLKNGVPTSTSTAAPAQSTTTVAASSSSTPSSEAPSTEASSTPISSTSDSASSSSEGPSSSSSTVIPPSTSAATK